MLRQAIEKVFKDDEDILKYYDPTEENINSTEDVISGIERKIYDNFSLVEGCSFFSFEGDTGYVFGVKDKVLISFGLSKENRNDQTKDRFWEFIKEKVGDNFSCLLFSKNSRGIGWLMKKGMTIEGQNELYTVLKT